MEQEKSAFHKKGKNDTMVSFVENDFVLNFLNENDNKPMTMYFF